MNPEELLDAVGAGLLGTPGVDADYLAAFLRRMRQPLLAVVAGALDPEPNRAPTLPSGWRWKGDRVGKAQSPAGARGRDVVTLTHVRSTEGESWNVTWASLETNDETRGPMAFRQRPDALAFLERYAREAAAVEDAFDRRGGGEEAWLADKGSTPRHPSAALEVTPEPVLTGPNGVVPIRVAKGARMDEDGPFPYVVMFWPHRGVMELHPVRTEIDAKRIYSDKAKATTGPKKPGVSGAYFVHPGQTWADVARNLWGDHERKLHAKLPLPGVRVVAPRRGA